MTKQTLKNDDFEQAEAILLLFFLVVLRFSFTFIYVNSACESH